MTNAIVLALAPDASSAQAAQKLNSPARWPTLNASAQSDAQPDGQWLWGECQGSGSKPYLVGIDLRTSELACKCSCPSRKFPCKHGLALLLLHVARQQGAGLGTWGADPVPEVIQKWLDGRLARSEGAAAPEAPEKAPVTVADPAARAKREAARSGKITNGLQDLHLWLQDLVRGGLAAARKLPYRTWDDQAARLIDAQVPGAARWVRQIPDYLHEGDGSALLAHLGKVALLCEGWANRDALSGAEQLQLLTALGQPSGTASLLAGAGQLEEWSVMGSVQGSEGKLEVRRTWLRRVQDGQVAMILDFVPSGRGFAPGLPMLSSAALDLRFVPTLYLQRAVLASPPEMLSWRAEVPELPPASVSGLYRAYAEGLAQNPWLERIAYCLGPVRVLPSAEKSEVPQIQDAYGQSLPLSSLVDVFEMMAPEQSRPLHMMGEWDGDSFLPFYWEAADVEDVPEPLDVRA